MGDVTWPTLRAGGRSVRLRVRGTEPDPGSVYLCPSVGEYPVYDELIYQVIRDDEQRNRRFRRAIEAVAPGAAVLEIGPGPDLLWTLVAAAAGARRVYAVEVLPDSARQARATAARHPAAPIEVLTGDATQVTLPERAQVAIAEIVGCLGGAEGLAAVLADAQHRLLTEHADVVPAAVRTRVAAVSLAGLLGGEPALAGLFAPYLEGIFRAAGGPFDVRMCLAGVGPDALRSSTGLLEDLRFGRTRAAGPGHRGGPLRLEITRPGPVDGLLAWIELTVAPGDPVLDSLADQTNWLPVGIPFAGDAGPVAARPGDVLELQATVTEAADGIHPEYFFDGNLIPADGGPPVPLYAESRFSGGPFRATPLHGALFR
jgi:type I protein arginine methyltransferase